MEQKTEKVFANGILFKRNENAPEFIVGSMSIKVDEAIEFINKHVKNGWVNIDIKQSQGGKYYCELDTWEAKPKNEGQASGGSFGDSIPF